jgi:hypothetical protein
MQRWSVEPYSLSLKVRASEAVVMLIAAIEQMLDFATEPCVLEQACQGMLTYKLFIWNRLN